MTSINFDVIQLMGWRSKIVHCLFFDHANVHSRLVDQIKNQLKTLTWKYNVLLAKILILCRKIVLSWCSVRVKKTKTIGLMKEITLSVG